MRCCLCGCEFDGFGNNPWPLISRTDYDSRCCNTCDEAYVIPARIQIHTDAMNPEEPVVPWNSTIAIFHATANPAPTEMFLNDNKTLVGQVREIKDGKYYGAWGDFPVDPVTDSFYQIDFRKLERRA